MTPLEIAISKANQAYWVDHKPVITDAEYDQLIERLKKVDPYNPLINKLDDGTKHECVHPYPMLSLNKVYNLNDLRSWSAAVSRHPDEKLSCQLKLDGCTCRVTDGRIYTRGDGHAGEDITSILPIIKGIERPNDLGEIVITNSDFTKYFVSGKILCKDKSLYQNQRNAVAGLLGRIGDIQNLPPCLTFVSYDYVCPTRYLTSVQLETVKIDDLVQWAFSFDYPLDGLVFKLDDRVYSNSLGNTAHHPRGQMAYKFENCEKETEIVDIEWTLGRTGIITPVVKVKPIDIHGSHISSVTAHDARHVLSMNICIGHKAKISRAGDVIPFLVNVWPSEQTRDKQPVLPKICPVCGKPLAFTATGVDLICQNPKCAGKVLKSLVYATKLLQMDGWSEQTLQDLSLKFQLNLYKLFTLSLEDLKQVFPGKRSDNLFRVKESVLSTLTEDKLLAALGIPLIGKENAKDILSVVSLAELADGKIERIPACQIKVNLQIWLMDNVHKINLRMILDLLSEIQKREFGSKTEAVQVISNGSVCFTGAVEGMTRNQLKVEAESRGYTTSDSVNNTLSILIAADPNSGSTKLRKATSLGIKIMSPDEFLALPKIK